jgi:dipeptidyl aminopeptidase/acylaminoacyl peptidase
MVMPRRWREHRISLSRDGTLEQATTLSRDPWWYGPRVPSQRRFLVSPDGRHLAYASQADGKLRVRGVAGPEITIERVQGRDARFSADGRYLAAVVSARVGRSYRPGVAILDLGTGARRVLFTAAYAIWIEWVRDGIVALHRAPGAIAHNLTFLPLTGEPRSLATAPHIERFTAAARAGRVVYFAAGEAYSIEIGPFTAAPRRLGPTPGRVENAEMSPDGRRVAFATAQGLWVIDREAAPRLFDATPGVHAVWFSRDGRRLAYASRQKAVVLDGSRRYELPTPWGLETMRFRAGTGALVVVQLDEVLLWHPGREPRRIAKVPGSVHLQGADLFAGQVVLWTSHERHGSGYTPRYGQRMALHPQGRLPAPSGAR